MSINYFELVLLNDFQEETEYHLKTLADKYEKGISTIKRNIENLNFYLSKNKRLKIHREKIISNISYNDKIDFIQKLTINDYFPKKEERINIILILAFLNNHINLSEVYKELELSLTTKKKDTKYLKLLLYENNLDVETVHKKGIKIVGEESKFRIIVARKIIDVIELDEEDMTYSRKANSPIEQIMFNNFKNSIRKQEKKIKKKLQNFIEINKLNMDYPSKKLLFVYYNLSLIRQKENNYVKITDEEKLLKSYIYNFIPNKNENIYINYLLASFNYDEKFDFPENKNVENISNFLIKYIEKKLEIKFHIKDKIFTSIYAYIYKSLLKNYLGYSFYDYKLEDIFKNYLYLFNILFKKSEYIHKKYNMKLSIHQISTLTLIFETYLLDNKTFGKSIKKIIIITNTSIEKLDFFTEKLSHYIEFEMVSHLTINEIYKLRHIEYDRIITFSNRISLLLLNEFDIKTVKINFYFDHTDIQKLIDNGFSEIIKEVKKLN